jgi:hypothetical protein
MPPLAEFIQQIETFNVRATAAGLALGRTSARSDR